MNDKQTIKITHPFTPMKGEEYIVIERITAWGEDRIICCDNDGNSRAFLTSWTDYLPEEPFITVSDGKVDFKYDDLQMLAKLVSDLKRV